MKTEFYTTFKTSTIDSVLMRMNQQGYGTISEWKEATFDQNRPESQKGAYWTSVPETWAAYAPLRNGNRDKYPGCSFVRNQYVYSNTGERESLKGRDRSSVKTKSLDQCVYDYMDSMQLNPSTTEEINYNKEYIAPDFGTSKNESLMVIQTIMLYKWIAGRHLIKFEQLQLTDAILKQFGFDHGIKNYFMMFKLLFESYCITNHYEDGTWTIKITKPAASVSLNPGPGQIKIDYITPNNKHIYENIIQDHEEYEKIISGSTETGGQEETTRLSAKSQDTRMVF